MALRPSGLMLNRHPRANDILERHWLRFELKEHTRERKLVAEVLHALCRCQLR